MKYIVSFLAIIVLSICLSGCSATNISDIDDYLKTDAPLLCGELTLFPASIDEDNAEGYNYYCRSSFFFDDQAIWLVASYDEAEYEEEANRLIPLATYDENTFAYPAVVVSFEEGNKYEYALFNESENKIIYVYAQYSSGYEQIPEQWRAESEQTYWKSMDELLN